MHTCLHSRESKVKKLLSEKVIWAIWRHIGSKLKSLLATNHQDLDHKDKIKRESEFEVFFQNKKEKMY